jgi:hypothetical protein
MKHPFAHSKIDFMLTTKTYKGPLAGKWQGLSLSHSCSSHWRENVRYLCDRGKLGPGHFRERGLKILFGTGLIPKRQCLWRTYSVLVLLNPSWSPVLLELWPACLLLMPQCIHKQDKQFHVPHRSDRHSLWVSELTCYCPIRWEPLFTQIQG